MSRSVHRLTELLVSGLTYRYPTSGRGIENVHLCLKHGSFTVIAGDKEAGKTTLLKALLGLLPTDAGEIYWNGARVEDPATFLVPPRCAHSLQGPPLVDGSIRNNILLGLPEEEADPDAAVRLAGLERDLAELAGGLDAPLGAHITTELRQRIAVARMAVRDPELMVLDDFSGAMDVEAERALWDRIFERSGLTCLVVSNRRPALRRADRIVVLRDGQIAAAGTLEGLLETCGELQRIWLG